MSEILTIENISRDIISLYSDNLKNILINISKEYDIDKNVLLSKYLKFDNLRSKKKKKKTELLPSCLCMARKQDGNQCTRRRKQGGEFCGKHIKNRKYGRIDDNSNIVGKLAEDDNYIMTWVEIFNGKEYLVDTNNVVYTKNISSPKIIGKKISDGVIKYLEDMESINI